MTNRYVIEKYDGYQARGNDLGHVSSEVCSFQEKTYSKGFKWIPMFQDRRVEQDFDIAAEASGVLTPVVRSYNAAVTNNTIEIRLTWAGKGTIAIPKKGSLWTLTSSRKIRPYQLISVLLEDYLSFSWCWVSSAGNTISETEGAKKKGVLADGTIIAVKQPSSKSRQGNRDQLLLVYEYMENNSLARALFGPESCQLELDWPTRQNICLGIARGLAFLHEESRFKIVHRDIKATNVLLDGDLNPKISDFGLAKLDEEDQTHISTRIAGTIGYMARAYALWGCLTYRADVYSFGVVAFEIVGLSFQQDGKLIKLVDQKLGLEYNKDEAEKMIKVSLLCTNASPSLRPTMSEVVSMLEGKTTIPDIMPEAGSYSEDLRFKALRDHQMLSRDRNSMPKQTQHSKSAGSFHVSSST
ncbi:putative Kinase [Melia azedarach]|uniref:Kinase n=1 Tax=Melia azedarach TaxID=155640 RepID=A0ACC1X0J6_MELAZ|nr:putative Kinase [Melia azedarach]